MLAVLFEQTLSRTRSLASNIILPQRTHVLSDIQLKQMQKIELIPVDNEAVCSNKLNYFDAHLLQPYKLIE